MPISVVLCSFHVGVVVEEYVDSLFLFNDDKTNLFPLFPNILLSFLVVPISQIISQPTKTTNQIHSFHFIHYYYYIIFFVFFFPSHGVTPFAFPFSSSSSSPYQTEREMVSPDNNPNWVFDYGLIEDIPVPGGHLPSLDPPGALWSSPSLSCQTPLSVEFDDPFGNSDGFKEVGSRKRMRTGSCSASGSKACREKMRRDRLNDRFLELGCILDPGRPPKVDKGVILLDAVRMVTQLRDEAQKLKESNESLQEKINELKVEKNELRDEKQRLKSEKENLERQVKALSSQPGFLPHPTAIPAPFSARGQVVGGKLVPFVGYPGVSMWQFMPPAAVDTSQDHVLRPPVA